MKLLDQQLNRAYLDKDTDKVHELYPQYKATLMHTLVCQMNIKSSQ